MLWAPLSEWCFGSGVPGCWGGGACRSVRRWSPLRARSVPSMLVEILHRVVAYPIVYDVVQSLAGTSELDRRGGVTLSTLTERAGSRDGGGRTGVACCQLRCGASE